MRMKKLILSLIKLIPLTFILFSFVACGGGGSSGGDDEVTPPLTPVITEESDGSVEISSPKYESLPVTISVNGVTKSGNSVSVKKSQPATFMVQEEYDSYAWQFKGITVTSGTLSENGRTCTFKPEAVGTYNLLVTVTKDGSKGSLSVTLIVSE